MKMLKKLTCVSLAAMMTVTFAGCTKTDAPSTTTPDASQTETSDKSNDTNNETAQEEGIWNKYEAVDLGGREFIFAYNWDMIPANTTDAIAPENTNAEVLARLENMKRIEEKYNCKITYINVPYEQISETLTTGVMAGEPMFDTINLSAGQAFTAVLGNQLHDLKDIVPVQNDLYGEGKILKTNDILDGQYAMQEVGLPMDGKYLAFNRDIIEGLGMKTPDELYAEGNWNWDTFMEIAKAATKDTTGDGVINQWGIGGTPFNIASLFVASNDGMLLDTANKKHALDDAKTVEALEMINKIYNVDKVGHIYNNDVFDWNGNQDAYKQGNIAMFYAETWMLAGGELPFEYGCAPVPVGPNNKTGAQYLLDAGGVGIPQGVKDPSMVYQIFEELNAYWGDNMDEKANNSRTWVETAWLTEEDVEATIEISALGMKIDFFNCIPGFPFGDIVNAIIGESKTVAQATEEYKQVAADNVAAVIK